MNNKGFAITTIIYGILILFMLLLVSLLGILSVYRNNLEKLVENENGTRDIVTINKNVITNFSEVSGRGLYCLNATCEYIGNGEAMVQEYLTPGTVYNFSYTAMTTGYYQIEAWGAQGGGPSGGKGAYTSGVIYLNRYDVLYIYVGNYISQYSGNCSQISPAYNCSTKISCSSGGGATDIRLVSGVWNDATSLNSRIMVAAGGGGYLYTGSGGIGGALIGGDGVGKGASANYFAGRGSSQTSGEAFGVTIGSTTLGGNGYYSGHSGAGGNAGGGSSFISGYAGVNAITSENDRTHTNNTLHYSYKYFVDGKMQGGVNSGNGKVKITYISRNYSRINNNLNNVRYVKDCINGNATDNTNRWNEIQVIKNGANIAKNKTVSTLDGTTLNNSSYVTDGDIGEVAGTSSSYAATSCIVIDLGHIKSVDEIAVWHSWYSSYANTKNNATYVSSDNNTWIQVLSNNSVETSNGKRVNAWNS